MPTLEIPSPEPAEPVNLAELAAPTGEGTCEAYPLPEVAAPPETDEDWAKGASAEDAKYVIYEYSDFQCPGCAGMAPVLQQYLDENPDVRLIYRHFPLTEIHALAILTAEAAEAAGAQGKFWEMHDLLFAEAQEAYTLYQALQSQQLSEEQQAEAMEQLNTYWIAMDVDAARERMTAFAEELDLDVDAFDLALDEGEYREKVEAQLQQAIDLQLSGTPTFIINDYLYPSDLGLSSEGLTSFKMLLENQDALFYESPPEMTVDVDAEYQATIETNQGTVVVDLLPEMAPVSVNSFVFLVEDGWYDGSEFFFVQEDFVAVTGDASNTTIGYPGYQCFGEERTLVPNEGLVWMLSNGQFFFTLGPQAYEQMVTMSQSPAQFALVGEVVEGLDTLQSLANRIVGDPQAPEADVIQSIEISQP